MPRAPKSHTGVPRPSRAGTNQTSPVCWQAAATVADSAAVSMMPRSSRSHSTQVPADSMMASMPQVVLPPRRQAMMGKVPAGPRPARSGGRVAHALVEHAAGAEGGLGLAAADAALADE